jgi:hypothetical protein
MKMRIISAISKLTLGIAVCTLGLTAAAHASGNPFGKTAEVKYIGTSANDIVFNVSYDNPTGGKFSVAVLDQDGAQIYQEVFTDKKFEKRFRFPKGGTGKVTFMIRNFKDADVKQSFEINTRVIEDVVVTKVG